MINAYYVKTDGEQEGPFTHIELMEKGIKPNTLVLSPLLPEWQYAIMLPELKTYFESEGIYYPTRQSTATFWWRLLAYAIDYALYMMLALVVGFAIGFLWRYTGVRIELFDEGSYNLGLQVRLFCFHGYLQRNF